MVPGDRKGEGRNGGDPSWRWAPRACAGRTADAGRLEQALDLEKKALAISPEYHIARLNLARIYIKSGDKLRAKAELDQLSKLGAKFAEQAEVTRLLQSLSG